MTGPGSSSPSSRLELPFRHAGRDSLVTVEISVNEDPAALGCRAAARGYPVCRATIAPPARGYDDALGWIQLVASSDTGDGGFAIDPFEPLGEAASPFCFFGFAPVLFDAPSRPARADVDWVAHSFLAELTDREATAAILGFSWGFRIRDGAIAIAAPAPLRGAEAWDRHLPVLAAAHPRWTFVPGLPSPSGLAAS
jgi:hypothetical protein